MQRFWWGVSFWRQYIITCIFLFYFILWVHVIAQLPMQCNEATFKPIQNCFQGAILYWKLLTVYYIYRRYRRNKQLQGMLWQVKFDEIDFYTHLMTGSIRVGVQAYTFCCQSKSYMWNRHKSFERPCVSILYFTHYIHHVQQQNLMKFALSRKINLAGSSTRLPIFF